MKQEKYLGRIVKEKHSWKWKNMTKAERNSVDGVIDSDDFREGEVTIYIFN